MKSPAGNNYDLPFIRQRSLSFWIASTLPGWLLAFLSNEIWVADCASIWASFILLAWFWTIVGKPFEMIRLVRLGAFSLCALQNIAWLTASFLHRYSLNISIETSLYQTLGGGLTFQFYALAVFYITIFSLILSWLGSLKILYEKEKFLGNALLNLKGLRKSYIRYLLSILFIIEVTLIIKGVIGQRSIIVEGAAEGERQLWVVLFESILPAHVLILALILSGSGRGRLNRLDLMIVLASLAVLMFIFFTKGRSMFMFTLIGLGYWLAFFFAKKPKLIKFLIVALIAYPIISQVLLFSNYIRGGYGESDWASKSAIELLPAAWEKFRSSGDALIEEKQASTKNVATRPLVAIPLAMCLQLPSSNKSFTVGEDFINSFMWALPGPMVGNKSEYPVQEALLYKHFPIGKEQDTADSVYLSSYTEFNWFGLFIYPVFIYLFWYLALHLSIVLDARGVVVAVVVSIFQQLFLQGIGENSMIYWLVAFRSFLFWIIVNKLISTIFPAKRRNVQPNRWTHDLKFSKDY